MSAVFAGAAAYFFYPNIKYCFLVIALSAVAAISFVPFLPQGNALMGRGLQVEEKPDNVQEDSDDHNIPQEEIKAASYLSVMSEPKTLVLCLTGFFFQ
jgi:hypothetical protein